MDAKGGAGTSRLPATSSADNKASGVSAGSQSSKNSTGGSASGEGTPSPSRHPIGQFFKRIRARSKSPAAGKRVLVAKQQAWAADGDSDHPDKALQSPNGHTRTIESQAKDKDTKSLPPRSPSGKKLKHWLSRDSSSQDQEELTQGKSGTGATKHGGFSTWMQARFGRSPSGRKARDFARTPAQNALRDQDQRGALSEEDLVSKSLASEMTNSYQMEPRTQTPDSHMGVSPKLSPVPPAPAPVMLSSYHSQDSVFDTPEKLPSYIRLSYALSGYSKYRTPADHPRASPLAGGLLPAASSTPKSSTGLRGAGYREPAPPGLNYQPTPKGRSIVERRLERFQNGSTDESHGSARNDDAEAKRNIGERADADGELRPVFAAEQLPTPVRELAGNFDRLTLEESEGKSSDPGPSREGDIPLDFDEKTPPNVTKRRSEDVTNVTPWSELVDGFEKCSLRDETPPSSRTGRPTGQPPPIPAPRKLVKDTEDLGTIQSVSAGSSAPTETCMSGPSSTAQDDEGSSFLDEVLKATEKIMTLDNGEGMDGGAQSRETPIVMNGHTSSHEEIEMNGEGGKMSVGEEYGEKAVRERKRLERAVEECERDLETVTDEDAAAYLRMGIGKCKLLLRKKFKTFQELVVKNMNPVDGDPTPTLDDDLEGYWPLVEMEIEDLDEGFGRIHFLRQNNWDIKALERRDNLEKTKNGPSSAEKPKSATAGSSPPLGNRSKSAQSLTNGMAAGAEKAGKGREEARERIRAAKLAAKQRMAAANQGPQGTDQFFVA